MYSFCAIMSALANSTTIVKNSKVITIAFLSGTNEKSKLRKKTAMAIGANLAIEKSALKTLLE
jgi:hypothetical protein